MTTPSRPVVFIHGLWLHATSWAPWRDLFREAGYDPIAPGWPGEPATVAEARNQPELVANIGIDDATDHFADIIGALDSTWELMRLRAVEPEHMDDPALGQMLPATYMATATRDVTISAVLSANIGVAQFMKVKP